MSHTPGPWKYHSAGVMVMDSKGELSIADIRGWGTLEKRHGERKALEIQDANGRLIAAAPELLAALEECTTEDGALCWRDFDTAKRRLEYINNITRLAIAKAKGEDTQEPAPRGWDKV